MKKVISIAVIICIISYAIIGSINTHKHAFIMKLGYYPKKEKVTEVKLVDNGTYEITKKTIYVKP